LLRWCLAVCCRALPLARLGEVDLARSADELVVIVAAHRRLLVLPSALRRCAAAGRGCATGAWSCASSLILLCGASCE